MTLPRTETLGLPGDGGPGQAGPGVEIENQGPAARRRIDLGEGGTHEEIGGVEGAGVGGAAFPMPPARSRLDRREAPRAAAASLMIFSAASAAALPRWQRKRWTISGRKT